jgi:hypothetical protein
VCVRTVYNLFLKKTGCAEGSRADGDRRDHGIGGFGMTRGDVEQWLAERNREATKLQLDTLWWAKAAKAGERSGGIWENLFGGGRRK